MAEFDNVRIADLSQYLLSTRNRPLRLVLDHAGNNASGQLLPQKVTGHEAICGGFEYRILCVAESVRLALKDFIGVPAELQVVTDRGQLRRLCGIVTGAASGQSDGGLATYQLVMRDALALGVMGSYIEGGTSAAVNLRDPAGASIVFISPPSEERRKAQEGRDVFKHQVKPSIDPENYKPPTVAAVLGNKDAAPSETAARP